MDGTPGLWQPRAKPFATVPDWSHLHKTAREKATNNSTSSTSDVITSQSSLLGLPLELRRMIWRKVLPYRSIVKVKLPDGQTTSRTSEVWQEGSVAIFRVNKQIHQEAMPILYGEELFSVMIQSRRALFVFSPDDPQKRPRFGLVTAEGAIAAENHAGLRFVRHWELLLTHHSVRGKKNQTLRCDGLQTFFKFIAVVPLQTGSLVIQWGKENTKFVHLQLVNAVVVGLSKREKASAKWKVSKSEAMQGMRKLLEAKDEQDLILSDEDFVRDVVAKGEKLLAQPLAEGKTVKFVTSCAGKKKRKPHVDTQS